MWVVWADLEAEDETASSVKALLKNKKGDGSNNITFS